MMCDTSATVRSLTAQGLNVTMAARLVAPMTLLLRERAQQLHERCPWGPDDSTYEITVIRAARACRAAGAGRQPLSADRSSGW
jgi:hypothetical protein